MTPDERPVAVALAISALAAVGLAVVYGRGGQPQAEGALLFVALGAMGVGLIIWAHRLLPPGPDEEPRNPHVGTVVEQRAVADALDADQTLTRRPFLRRMLLGATGALGLAAVFPIRSLGPGPGRSLTTTPWHDGVRLVNSDNEPIRADELPLDGVVTVFPEGAVGSANGQALLIRLLPELIMAPPGRETWSPNGLIAYSKVCTHAGCPVGLYQAKSKTLLCPCHQSEFDARRHARPISGPAAAPLPQLPLRINVDGFLEATGDFSDPVGPTWWSSP